MASGSQPDWLELCETDFQRAYRPKGNPSSRYLHRALVRALGSTVTRLPDDATLGSKPLTLELALPLPGRLRFYLYGATQHPSERQQGTFKVQLTVGVPRDTPAGSKLCFERTDDIRPILAGYEPDLKVFILWDANLHDAIDGFPYSKNVQAPPGLVWEAASRGLAMDCRRLKRPATTEWIVAARPRHLVDALQQRIRLSNEVLLEGLF